MSTNDRIARLRVYLEEMEQKLKAKEVPAKHKDSEPQYRDWLKLEVKRTKMKLEELSLTGK